MIKPAEKVKVLFVCMGNICRSPAAEGVFRDYVQKSGHAALIQIDSAGTIGYHAGSPPDYRIIQIASRRGYRLDSLARQVIKAEVENFDLIIVMDYTNLRDLEEIAGSLPGHVRLLGHFLDGAGTADPVLPVPDPYYGGIDGFEKVIDMIESACPAMLEYCLDMEESRSTL